MNEARIENNKVTLSGKIVSNFEFNHKVYGEGFYTTMLATERLSSQKDIIPIMVSERLADVKTDWIGINVDISGQLRSYNKRDGNKNHLIISVFATGFGVHIEEFDGEFKSQNHIFLDGYICKPPIYRKTPLGREIADLLVAVNRQYRKTDYIPCISWGRNACFSSNLEVGTRLRIKGRIQSREYIKKISETKSETRVAYEVSTGKLEVIENEQGKD